MTLLDFLDRHFVGVCIMSLWTMGFAVTAIRHWRRR